MNNNMDIVFIITSLLGVKRQKQIIQGILLTSYQQSKHAFEEFPSYNEIITLVSRIIKQKQHHLVPRLCQEILIYNIYVIAVLPLLRLVEIVKQTLRIKYIQQIQHFEPFTPQQVQDEAIYIFSEFLDQVCQKGTKNVYMYLKQKVQLTQITGGINWKEYYEDKLRITQRVNSKDLIKPNDFKRQSSLIIKHLVTFSRPKMSDFSDIMIDDHIDKQDDEVLPMNDIMFIFLGDAHYHKYFEDPEHLLNMIEHMTPQYWCTKYMPLLHRISECIEDEDIDVKSVGSQNHKEQPQRQIQKVQFASIMRRICQQSIDIMKCMNFQTIYMYYVQLSIQKFYSRLQQQDLQQSTMSIITKLIYPLTQMHSKERNYKLHFIDSLKGKSNDIIEITRALLIERSLAEFVGILFQM